MSDVLIHHTIETGDTRRSPRSEVSPETVELLRGVLLEALALWRQQAGVQAVEIEPTQRHVAAVDIFITLTAAPITSAGRFSPFGPVRMRLD